MRWGDIEALYRSAIASAELASERASHLYVDSPSVDVHLDCAMAALRDALDDLRIARICWRSWASAVATEDTYHGDVGAVEQVRQFAGQQPRGIGPPVVRAAGTGGNQVGIGRRQQQHGRIGHDFLPQSRSYPSEDRPAL
jgi:hypothetical protein